MIEFQTLKKQKFYLEIDNSLIKKAEMWLFQKGRDRPIRYQQSGITAKRDKRGAVSRNSVFELDIKPISTYKVYLKLKTNGAIIAPLTLMNEAYFENKQYSEKLRTGIYFGLILAITMFNIFLFAIFKDKIHLAYATLLISLHLTMIPLSFGFYNEYITQWSHEYFRSILLIGEAICLGLVASITSKVLSLSSQIQNWQKIKYSLYLVLAALALMSTINAARSLVALVLSLILIIMVVFLFAIAVKKGSEGIRTAQLFLISWSVLFIGSLGYAFLGFGLWEYTDIKYLVPIGAVIEAITTTFNINKKINTVKMSKDSMSSELDTLKYSLDIIAPANPISGIGDQTHILVEPPKKQLVTIMYVDFANYSTNSEINYQQGFSFKARKSMQQLIEIIESKNGIIQGSYGDSLIAFFGVEVTNGQYQVEQALSCAAKIHKTSLLKLLSTKNNDFEFCYRIAINTKQTLTGNKGTAKSPLFTISGPGLRETQNLLYTACPLDTIVSRRSMSFLPQKSKGYAHSRAIIIPASQVQEKPTEGYRFEPFKQQISSIEEAKAIFRSQFVKTNTTASGSIK